MTRWARKRDANERAIVLALRAAGASVTQLDGSGVPDLLVGYQGRTLLAEVKDPAQGTHANRASSGGSGTLTSSQVLWHRDWRGAPVAIVESVADAMEMIHP